MSSFISIRDGGATLKLDTITGPGLARSQPMHCWLNGAEDLVRHAEKKLGCKHGETSADGRITLKVEEECVAACAGAVAVVIDGHYHERVTPNTLDQLFDGLK